MLGTGMVCIPSVILVFLARRLSSSVETSSILISIEGRLSQRLSHIFPSIESEVPRIIRAFGPDSTSARLMTDDLVGSVKIA